MDSKIDIVFVDRQQKWNKTCKRVQNNMNYKFKNRLSYMRGDIREIRASYNDSENYAFVSPANSFGWMDGGIDMVYTNMFNGVGEAVREVINAQSPYMCTNEHDFVTYRTKSDKNRMIPVGSGLIVPIPNKQNVYMISVPTMVVPRDVKSSQNAYYATLAAMRVLDKYNKTKKDKDKIRCIYIPGMATGCGKMPFPQAIRQMMTAIKDWETSIGKEEVANFPNMYLPVDIHNRDDVDMSGYSLT